ncbi:MAG TPA: hypothetical protein PLX68_13860 [Dermatophilaceae bacterium]|jgi:hypothetical protein|nr:hypothetical protein [Candidatus Phosphoribacter baldrii]HRC13960.1 hypothetical protein [Dermatophilaceae bacterium]
MTTRPEIALPEPAQPPSNFTSRRAARLAREGAGLAERPREHVNDPLTAPRDSYARALRAGDHADTHFTMTDVQS